MAPTTSLLRYVCSLVLLACCAQALRFDLQATSTHEGKKERCIRNFVARDTLVVVTAIVDGSKGDGMTVNMHVCGLNCYAPYAILLDVWIKDAVGNDYGKPKDIAGGEKRVVFTSHADAAFDVCFENILSGSGRSGATSRHIELDIDIGADAKDWNAIQATEKLKPVEAELRRIDELVSEINTEMDYLRAREHKLRDTNESTNTRVKWFGIGTTLILVGLWGWQIMYLRAYFRSKHLI
ncbi:endoplasmic reticulum vesicle protein 25 [Colletotrichum godetiae]|uniref:Endoplasmic reticulum vesicle protein 25 n=1 Tax=Colletotrichum godetiae TaxID=1209918 RepID=A0AAJ0AZH5_9PEZI|nr:endoplasmic reticulum vesicle protein 25 [Colletotrichum godetiae]KAK1700355.1 endoplasmic reticulum vesicle protein 25 [Colletotrichum godetiae]